MQLHVDACVTPVRYSEWQDNVSILLAHPMLGRGQGEVEHYFACAWHYAREAEKSATELAGLFRAAGEESIAIEAERIAKRHAGVCRAATKMQRQDSNGKTIRAVAMIRADAGDATCPTWLEREAKKRKAKMQPLFQSARLLGYRILAGMTEPITRQVAYALRDELCADNSQIAGLDIHIIPSSATTVRLHAIGAFTGCDSFIVNHTHAKVHFHAVTETESIYNIAHDTAREFGPFAWISAQLMRVRAGKHQRDRITTGIFYGKAADALVCEAAARENVSVSPQAANELEKCRTRILDAIMLCKEAAEQGDLVAAKAAHGFAVAYAQDAQQMFAAYPAVAASLFVFASFDFAGLNENVVLASTHESLLKRIHALAAPLPRVASAWECLERVTIHSPRDITALAQWMRQE